MGCFFGCFRVKDSGANLVSPSEPVAHRSKHALSTLFQCDGDSSVFESLREEEEGRNQLPVEIDIRELKDVNNFSISSGTPLETPVKVRKAFEKWEAESAQTGAEKSLKFDSWLPNQKQFDESSTPVKSCVAGSVSLLDTPSSCMTDALNGGISSSLVQESDMKNSVKQSKNESVRFHHASSDTSAISSISSDQSLPAGAHGVTKPSPYPNPEKLAEGETEDEDSDSASNHSRESVKQKDLPVIEEMSDEGSLTSWFKPISAKQNGGKQCSSISRQRRKPPADRPILGMVAAHWNDDETPSDPPKWWDGNGIPNSTNKYKEDQKVSWHATPFKERLEKALSEESSISQKKPTNRAPSFGLNESEESDTAISHFESSPRTKSVVSF